MKRILLLITLLFFTIIHFSFKKQNEISSPTFLTEHVVVLVIDGPRYTETFGDTSYQFIPRLGKELQKEGVLYTNFMNKGITHTTPGHVALTTGNYQRISNGGKHLPKKPSMFQYYLKEKKVDKSKAWIISSKGKLDVLGDTKHKKWWNNYNPSLWCGALGNGVDYVGDLKTWEKIQEVFTNHAPKLTLINLLEVDVKGHQNDWEGYKKALRNTDELAYKIWNYIQNHPVMKDKTTLLITNDHGRHLDGHKDGFISHGDKCMGCKHIYLLGIGPDFPKNKKVDSGGELIDISKTISHMLHFSMPSSKGKVLNELFER
jgi:hypothetical protein